MNLIAGIRFPGAAQAPLIAASTVAGFSLLLLAVLGVGLPIWSLLIPVAAIIYIFTTLNRPLIGLYAVLAVFFTPLKLSIGISLLQSVGGATAGLLLVWFFLNKRTIVLDSFLIPLFLLGVLILMSLWYTRDAPLTLMHFRRWVFNMLFVMLLLNLVTHFDVFKKILWAVMIMASINSVVAMIEFSRSSEYGYRSIGLMENANNFGHLAALAFPLALYQYLYAKGALRWVGLVLCAILVGGVVASVSRGALVSLFIVFAVVMVLERRRWLPIMIIGGLAFGSIPLLPEYFIDRVRNITVDVKNSITIGNDRSMTTRGHLNTAGLRIWAAHPVVGVGIGNFGYYYSRPAFAGGMRAEQSIVAHNIYIQAMAEMGTVGIAVLAWLLLNAGRSLFRARRLSRWSQERWLYFGAVEMMTLAIVVSTATYGSLMGNDLWMFLGLAAIAGRVACEGAPAGMEAPNGAETLT